MCGCRNAARIIRYPPQISSLSRSSIILFKAQARVPGRVMKIWRDSRDFVLLRARSVEYPIFFVGAGIKFVPRTREKQIIKERGTNTNKNKI